MDRRTFNKLAKLRALGALADVEMSTAQAATVAGEVMLEDAALVVAFDPGTGALTRMEGKTSQWPIQRRPALGVSFRIHAPLPTRRTNFILGSKNRAKSVEKISANQVRIVWSDLESQYGGVLPITFTS